ncbi:MAG: EAL domain-containing protein [Telluria sp.]|nr:EAL domain-containing protein [Telluria sp.]
MGSHMVRFYQNDTFLIAGLAEFIGSALAAGDTAIAIATGVHLAQLKNRLLARGLPGSANFIALDAERLMPLFMHDGALDQSLFRQLMGDSIAAATKDHEGRICIFGEMVALLCAGGSCSLRSPAKHDATILIERYFNDLMQDPSFSILCAYPLNAFPRAEDSAMFEQVCALHSEVLPAEGVDARSDLQRLQRTIATLQQRAYSLASEVREREQIEQALREVNIDRLTGLPNRSVFHDRLEMDLKKAHRTGLSVALLFIDLDHFKEINDTLGHATGDLLLKQVGQRLASYVRESDTVTRLGGDEFTITLAELHDVDTVTDVAQKILLDLAGPFQLGEEVAYISTSIGITLFPQDASTAGELLRNADQAMYQSKDLGRNRFSYFTRSMQEAAQTRMNLSRDLRRAIGGAQLEVFYQPIVELANAKLVKAEALIRWHHPENGDISPTDFIPIAEHTGMIVPIGDWVFRQALQQSRRWRACNPDLTVSVNVSPVQFYRSNGAQYCEWLAQCGNTEHAGEASAPPVGLEITEGLMLRADNSVMNQLTAFQNAGIELSLDDFGTGYASLSYLRKFNLDYLKIDKSFVFNLENDAANVALCEAIIVMAHKLGLKVIAEGVETAHQSELLRHAGCDFGQGFLFGRPVPAEQFEALLLNSGDRPQQTA